jgi:hypothetical protein
MLQENEGGEEIRANKEQDRERERERHVQSLSSVETCGKAKDSLLDMRG